MIQNTKHIRSLQNIDESIFLKILSFIDPQTTSSLALTSRNLRTLTGKNLNKAVSIQKDLFNQQFLPFQNCIKLFEDYVNILEQCDVFNDTKSYQKFISQLNSNNMSLYSNFFSIIQNKFVHIENKTISQIKKQFQDGSQIYLALKDLQKNPKIPSAKIEGALVEVKFTPEISKLITFIDNIIKTVKQIQQKKYTNQLFQQFRKNQQYLLTNKWVNKIKLQNQYEKKLYFMKQKNKCYHNFMSFNQNSIIFSFLTAQDLRNLNNTDKIFASQIPKLIPLIQRDQSKGYIHEDHSAQFEILQLLDNNEQKLTKNQIAEIQCFINPPAVVFQIFSLVFQIFRLPQGNNYKINLRTICSQDYQYYKFLFESEVIDLDQQQFELIQQYFNQSNLQQIQNVSTVCAKVYKNLQINYEMKRKNIKKDQILASQEYRVKLQKINKMKEDLIQLQKELEKQKS